MNLIAITTPKFREREHIEICRLIDCGWSRVHIRKPDAELLDIENLIRRIPPRFYPFISLHDHFDIAKRYRLGGIHLNMRNPEPPHDWHGLVSRSCHSIDETRRFAHLDYLTLSPVFDSISKPGYTSRFTSAQLRSADLSKVYALGGITRSRLPEVESLGFAGAAMLSEAWKNSTEMLQFITHTADGLEDALRGGCRWVQLRMKDASDDQFIETAGRIIPLCRNYGAKVIFDDRVHLVVPLGADGVHVGKNDMHPSEARKILGHEKIIGATANTEEDLDAAYAAGADYIGLGPYRFTTTKKGLAPILGAEGYQRLMEHRRRNHIAIPVVAIGGIGIDDIPVLKSTGVDGIAVSGLILNSTDRYKTTRQIIESWEN